MSEPKSALAARRSFLKAVGASAAALPFYKMLEDSHVKAAAGVLPLRFVGMAGYHGTTQRFYARQPGETDTNFDISYPDSCLRPFDYKLSDGTYKYGYSFKDRINIFEGFDFGVGRAINSAGIELDAMTHGSSPLFLTGSSPKENEVTGNGRTAQNASLDQYLAGLYGGAENNGPKFRSVVMRTEDIGAQTANNSMSVADGGALLTSETNPEKIWDKYFTGVGQSNNAAAQAAADRQRRVGVSILDYVTGDLQRLSARLANPEKQKLDLHLTTIRDLENQLKFNFTAPAGCAPPQRHPVKGDANSLPYVVSNSGAESPDLDRVADMQIELLAQILICDLTRFATIVLPFTSGAGSGKVAELRPSGQMTGLTGTLVPDSPGTDYPTPWEWHNMIAHQMDDFGAGFNLEVAKRAASMQRWYHGKMAKLMERLQAAGVLDHTVILMGNEGGSGKHHTRNVPIVMAAGKETGLRTGRRTMAPGRFANPGENPTTTPGGPIAVANRVLPTSHNPILVAVANAFHRGAGHPEREIDKYGTPPHDRSGNTMHPEFVNGIQGFLV